MSEDELEFQLKVIEIDHSIQSGINEIEGGFKQKPDWWQIAIGHKPVELREYEAAKKIYDEFLRFFQPESGYYSGKRFDDILAMFQLAKMHNRL